MVHIGIQDTVWYKLSASLVQSESHKLTSVKNVAQLFWNMSLRRVWMLSPYPAKTHTAARYKQVIFQTSHLKFTYTMKTLKWGKVYLPYTLMQWWTRDSCCPHHISWMELWRTEFLLTFHNNISKLSSDLENWQPRSWCPYLYTLSSLCRASSISCRLWKISRILDNRYPLHRN